MTKLGKGSVADLQEDHVMMNALDMVAILNMQITCTSCKAKEKAVARCKDCANFLCPNCVTAHQFMRCFENHKVRNDKQLSNWNSIVLYLNTTDSQVNRITPCAL